MTKISISSLKKKKKTSIKYQMNMLEFGGATCSVCRETVDAAWDRHSEPWQCR